MHVATEKLGKCNHVILWEEHRGWGDIGSVQMRLSAKHLKYLGCFLFFFCTLISNNGSFMGEWRVVHVH